MFKIIGRQAWANIAQILPSEFLRTNNSTCKCHYWLILELLDSFWYKTQLPSIIDLLLRIRYPFVIVLRRAESSQKFRALGILFFEIALFTNYIRKRTILNYDEHFLTFTSSIGFGTFNFEFWQFSFEPRKNSE